MNVTTTEEMFTSSHLVTMVTDGGEMSTVTPIENNCSLTQETWAEEENREFARVMLPVTVFMVVLMVAGFLGNTVVCVVYLLKKKKKTFQVCSPA